MSHSPLEELQKTITIFKTLLVSHSVARERLVERRGEAITGEQISKLDQLIAINGRTIDSVKRALQSFESQLAQLENAAQTTPSAELQPKGAASENQPESGSGEMK